MEEFVAYLKKKRIDPDAFKAKDPERWNDFLKLFKQVHPDSFTAQKLFLINQIRRRFPLEE